MLIPSEDKSMHPFGPSEHWEVLSSFRPRALD
jgi:hypothetical protein